MKLVITGGTGCLGKPLLDGLIKSGHDVQLLVLPQDTSVEAIRGVRMIKGDVSSYESLKTLTKECQIILHLAGKVHSVSKSEIEEQEYYRINVDGTKNLLEAAKVNKVNRIVFFSTVGVYGKDADFQGDELSPCCPLTAYAKSKFIAEKLVLDTVKDGGPEGVVLRFPVVYGPLDRGNVAALIKAVRKKQFFYFGDGNCLRSMISSKNAAEAATKAAFEPEAADELFCVTDGRDYTMNELVNSICRALGTRRQPYHVPVLLADLAGRCGDFLRKRASVPFPIDSDRVRKLSRSLTFSCEKAKRILGYKAQHTLIEGITDEVEWLSKTHGWK